MLTETGAGLVMMQALGFPPMGRKPDKLLPRSSMPKIDIASAPTRVGTAYPAPFDQPFHLILNLAFGGRWPEGANAKGVDETALPATMEVDWVRVSQRGLSRRSLRP